MTHELHIPDWKPVTLNRLMRMHHGSKSRKLKADAQIVAAYAQKSGIPKARTKRRVSVCILHGGPGPGPDADACLKSLLDALKGCGLLRDDGPGWCELGSVATVRADRDGTRVILEDME